MEEGKWILENSEQKLCQLLKFGDSRKISSSASKESEQAYQQCVKTEYKEED